MKHPIELLQKDVSLPPAMADGIRERAEKLEHYFDRIQRCRITVAGSGKHHRHGRYAVTIDLTVPRAEIVIRKKEAANLELALKGAFDAAARRLEDHVRKMRGFTKTHEVR